jgi:hypothetical protein
VSAVLRWLADAYHRLVSATPGGALGLLVIIAVVAGVVLVLLRRRGVSVRARRRAGAELDVPVNRTADDLRREADALAARGEWAEAVRARLRAVVRALEERGIVDPRPGRTAAEVAAEAGSARPDLRDALWSGALTFGEIWYGDRRATASDDRVLAELDAAVRQRRPNSPVAVGPLPAAPQR